MIKRLVFFVGGVFLCLGAPVFADSEKIPPTLQTASILMKSIKGEVLEKEGTPLVDISLTFDILIPDACHGPWYAVGGQILPPSMSRSQPPLFMVLVEFRPAELCAEIATTQTVRYFFRDIQKGTEHPRLGIQLNDFHLMVSDDNKLVIRDLSSKPLRVDMP